MLHAPSPPPEQYAEFLQHALPEEQYRALLPSMEVRPPCRPPPACSSSRALPLATCSLHASPALYLTPPPPPHPVPRHAQELARDYCVDPELIFSLYRPLIRGIAPPAAAGAADGGAGGAAEAGQEEEGEIGEISTSPAGGAKGGAEAMEEDGQLEAGEVAAPGGAGAPPPPPPPDAAQRWEELEAQVGWAAAGRG